MRLLLPLLIALGAGAEIREAWLELDEPGTVVPAGADGWLEVRGRAGVGSRRGHDLVIALDLSASTWLASGVDVDGDGHLGRASGKVRQLQRRNIQTRRLERTDYSTDPDDSTGAALVAAARALVEDLDPRTRVALVDFAESAEVAAPLGASPEALRTVLDEIAERGTTRGGQTDFAAAIRSAVALLGSPDGIEGRTRTLLLLSDGHPTFPAPPSEARAQALAAAYEASAAGVRIFAFALGPEAQRALPVFKRLAALTDGRMRASEKPGDVLVLLPRTRLAGIARLTVENRTTAAEGSAVRLFPDGSFDGFVRLAPGANEILVRAEAETGESAEATRQVHFAPREPRDAEEARQRQQELEALLRSLRVRTAESELRLEIERVRERWGRELELEAEARRADPEAQ